MASNGHLKLAEALAITESAGEMINRRNSFNEAHALIESCNNFWDFYGHELSLTEKQQTQFNRKCEQLLHHLFPTGTIERNIYGATLTTISLAMLEDCISALPDTSRKKPYLIDIFNILKSLDTAVYHPDDGFEPIEIAMDAYRFWVSL